MCSTTHACLLCRNSHVRQFMLAYCAGLSAFDNSCLLTDTNLVPPTLNAPQSFLKDCPAWVINTTDEVWNTRLDVNGSLERYFYSDWSSTSAWGHKVGGDGSGMQKLKNLVASTMVAFPDLRIHITDVLCYGNDIDGYKTVLHISHVLLRSVSHMSSFYRCR